MAQNINGWYPNADYYITGKGEKKDKKYIGKLQSVVDKNDGY